MAGTQLHRSHPGTLPPHVAIERMERVKLPSPGVLLTTDKGFNLHLGSDSSMLIDMLLEQLEGLSHPTWSELVQHLRLPRRLELAEATANDVLRSHGEQSAKIIELDRLLNECSLF